LAEKTIDQISFGRKSIGQISFGQKVNWSNIIWPKSQLVKYHLDKSQ